MTIIKITATGEDYKRDDSEGDKGDCTQHPPDVPSAPSPSGFHVSLVSPFSQLHRSFKEEAVLP